MFNSRSIKNWVKFIRISRCKQRTHHIPTPKLRRTTFNTKTNFFIELLPAKQWKRISIFKHFH